MRRDTVFRRTVHLVGPDLDLKWLSGAADQRGVQRLVHVGLGHGDIVLEPSGNRLVHLVDHAQGRVAVLYRLHHDAHRKQIVDLVHRLVLVHHFLINAEEVLDPAAYRGLDIRLLHMPLDFRDDFLDKGLSGVHPQVDLLHQVKIHVRLQKPQRQIIQLDLDLGNTQTVGNGRVDLQRLPGLFLLLFRLPELSRPHVVQAVRQLDDNDADVLGHGQKHLAEVFRLDLHLVLVPGQLSQFGDAIYQERNF